MNPLLNEDEEALRQRAREQAATLFGGVAADVDASGDCPADAIATYLDATGTADDVAPRLALALVVEEAARAHAGIGAAVAALGTGRLLAASHGFDVAAPTTVVSGADLAVSDDGVQGVSRPGPGVLAATAIAVLADDGIYRVEAPGTKAADLEGLPGAGVASVALDQPAGARVADGAAAGEARELVKLLQAAVALGVCAAAQDVALEAVRRRAEAGDRADRSQSVQWALADSATDAEAARVSVWEGACAATLEQRGSIALVLASEAAVNSTRRAVEIGGLDALASGARASALHHAAHALAALDGGAAVHLGVIADALLPDIPRS